MSQKQTYEELEQRIKELEKEAVEGKRVKKALQQSIREISFLNALGYQVTSNLSFDQVAQSALDGIFKLIHLDMALLFMRDRDKLFLKGENYRHQKFRLKDTGVHKVGECLCGMAASEKRAIYSIDMPNMTGDDLAKELKRISPKTPVILCTGYSTRINQEQAKAMGIRAFVSKPVLIKEIAKTIRKVLDGN